MKKKYKVRHKILSHLYSKVTYTDNDKPLLHTTVTSLQEIAKSIGYTYTEVYEAHHGIPDEQARCTFPNKVHSLELAGGEGISAVLDEYWLREGQKELNERIYDTTKWALPAFALLVTLVSLFYSIYFVRQMQDKLNVQEQKIKSLELRLGSKISNI